MECSYSRCQNLSSCQENPQCSCSLRPANICSFLFSPVPSPVSVTPCASWKPLFFLFLLPDLSLLPTDNQANYQRSASSRLLHFNSALSQEVCVRAHCVCLPPQRVWADMSAKSPKLCLLSNFDVKAPAKQKSLA